MLDHMSQRWNRSTIKVELFRIRMLFFFPPDYFSQRLSLFHECFQVHKASVDYYQQK